MVHYANIAMCGLNRVGSHGDGYSIYMNWFRAYADSPHNQIAYHLYYSKNRSTVFKEGVKYVVIDGNQLNANITDLTPGEDYWFSMRPVEYDPTVVDFLPNLPIAYDDLRFYPTSLLRENMTATQLTVPLVDVEGFPSYGIAKVGIELIEYLAVDTVNKNLIVPGPGNNIPATLVLQHNGKYFLPGSNNIGQGTIDSLITVGSAPTENWRIICVFVEKDRNNFTIPETAIFEVQGSISGNIVDGYGNYITWKANGKVVTNGILSFSIADVCPSFEVGDSFLIQVIGPIDGALGGRGFNSTPITSHTISGFDGYSYWNSLVTMIAFQEDNGFDQVYACQSRFEYPNFPFTILDGYNQVLVDILSTDLSAADAANVTFPEYDYAGYHRTDPVLLLNGTCVGSYIGGQMGCIDGNGNYNIYRGFSLQDQNTQRQEIKLSVDGRDAILIRRVNTGVTCACYLASSEYPDDRCPFCYGTKFVFGYEQYFNPRISSGHIRVRTSPTAENLKMHEAGLESEFPLDMWTLTVPTIKTRDVIVLFTQAGDEEFRYEVGDVTRNNTILGLDGGQNFKTFRVRKTDPIYQIRIFRDTSDFPQTLNTSLGFSPGLPPHSHTIVVNEGILAVCQINQTTGVSQGHNHPVIGGIIQEVLGHNHTIILS